MNAIMVANEQRKNREAELTVELVAPLRWKSALGVMVSGNATTKAKKEKTLHFLEADLGKEWCDLYLRGPRGGYKDGIGDSVAILRYIMRRDAE